MDFHKIAQSSLVNSKETENKEIYLVRCYDAPGEDISRCLNDKGHSYHFFATSRFCDIFKKICDNSDPENWILDPKFDSVQLTLSLIAHIRYLLKKRAGEPGT